MFWLALGVSKVWQEVGHMHRFETTVKLSINIKMISVLQMQYTYVLALHEKISLFTIIES